MENRKKTKRRRGIIKQMDMAKKVYRRTRLKLAKHRTVKTGRAVETKVMKLRGKGFRQ